jgi:predicted site-specific integrase-resolvase
MSSFETPSSDNGSAVVSLTRWIEKAGISSCTAWRWRKKGWLEVVNICGHLYLTTEAIREFRERAARGEFAKAPRMPNAQEDAL